MSKYKRSINAALRQTKSRFALAEALAADLPAQQGKAGVRDQLIEVRKAILDAGGEDLAVDTLEAYRKVALHFGGSPPKWVDGFSYSAHEVSYKMGISADDFRANPRTVYQMRLERSEAKAAAEREARRKVDPRERMERQQFWDALAEPMHIARSVAGRTPKAREWLAEATASRWWNRQVPGETVNRTHGEQVLGDIDKAIEGLQAWRVEAAELIREADERVKAENAREEQRKAKA